MIKERIDTPTEQIIEQINSYEDNALYIPNCIWKERLCEIVGSFPTTRQCISFFLDYNDALSIFNSSDVRGSVLGPPGIPVIVCTYETVLALVNNYQRPGVVFDIQESKFIVIDVYEPKVPI